MDKKEAHSILCERLTHCRTLSYSELSTWVSSSVDLRAMLKKHLIVLAAVATLVLGGAAFLSPARVFKLPPSPVAVSYMGDGEFCLTNHTSKTLSVQIWYIEVKSEQIGWSGRR